MDAHLRTLAVALPLACLLCGAVGYTCGCELFAYHGSQDIRAVYCTLFADEPLSRQPKRRLAYQRRYALWFVETQWTDKLFRSSTGIYRWQFTELRNSLVEVMAPRDAYMGYVAGGGVVSVDTKLLVTMRMLRGASYLDMTWYGVPENHVDTYFLETVTAMNRCRLLDNVKLPSTDAEVEAVMAKWAERSMDTVGMALMPGTIGAVDGFHVRIRRPGDAESDGRPDMGVIESKGGVLLTLVALGLLDPGENILDALNKLGVGLGNSLA